MAKTTRMEQIEAMLADDPNDSFLRYGLAMEHASQGDDESAVRVLRELIAVTPDQPYVPAFHMLGQALARVGRESEAAAALREGIVAARKVGDGDALGEMEVLLSTLE
jgi:predicted Zn-dependent protease